MASYSMQMRGALDRVSGLWRRIYRREVVIAMLAYAGLLSAVYPNIVFFGDSLVYSNNLNLLDFGNRITPRLVPAESDSDAQSPGSRGGLDAMGNGWRVPPARSQPG
jgi:hypothetical protein